MDGKLFILSRGCIIPTELNESEYAETLHGHVHGEGHHWIRQSEFVLKLSWWRYFLNRHVCTNKMYNTSLNYECANDVRKDML